MHEHAETMQMACAKMCVFGVCVCVRRVALSLCCTHTHTLATFKVHSVHQGCHFHSAPSSWRHGPFRFYFFPLFFSLSSVDFNPPLAVSCRDRVSLLSSHPTTPPPPSTTPFHSHPHNVHLQSGQVYVLDLITSAAQINGVQILRSAKTPEPEWILVPVLYVGHCGVTES